MGRGMDGWEEVLMLVEIGEWRVDCKSRPCTSRTISINKVWGNYRVSEKYTGLSYRVICIDNNLKSYLKLQIYFLVLCATSMYDLHLLCKIIQYFMKGLMKF